MSDSEKTSPHNLKTKMYRRSPGLEPVPGLVHQLVAHMFSDGYQPRISEKSVQLEKLKLRSISEPLNVYSPLVKDMPCISSLFPYA